MRRRPGLVAVVLSGWMTFAGTANAERLPIAGNYGNKDGCLYALTGETTGSDDLFLLTPEAVTTAVSHCSFQTVRNLSVGRFDVTVTCEEEGNTDELAPFDIAIESVGSDSFLLNIDDGSSWGPLALCR